MTALVAARHLTKEFPGTAALFGRGTPVRALAGVTLDVARGETLAVAGESGSGKTTLGRCLVRLTEPTAGEIRFDGTDILLLPRVELRRWRRRAQYVFQDPGAALNPRLTIGAAIREPLRAHRLAMGSEAVERLAAALTEVGLDASHASRLPHELSGGQKQRAVIARALIVQPEFLVLDEPVSNLDVSVAAQILNLLADLRQQRALTYLLIAHDLRVVRHFSERVAVMYAGRFVEVAPTAQLYAEPRHPYTAALLSSVPAVEPTRRRERIVLAGETPAARRPTGGCPFEPRCPHARKDERCRHERPELRQVGPGHFAACHYADEMVPASSSFLAPPGRGRQHDPPSSRPA